MHTTTSTIRIDFANCMSDRVGDHGLDPVLFDAENTLAQSIRSITGQLRLSRGTGWERWRDLHRDPMRSDHLSQVRDAVDACKSAFPDGVENLVVLGIGGSALGNIAVQSALRPPVHNLLPSDVRRGPRVFVLDNVDPVAFGEVLGYCDAPASKGGGGGLERTVFNVISKSGETAETAAQFMIVRDMLKSRFGDAHQKHIVAVTDPAKGTMRTICDANGYRTLPVPDGVGGRFSVLSPVGLFSAAMCGMDIEAMLDGAADMDEPTCNPDIMKNPAALLAAMLVEFGLSKGKTNHVMMPYANQLYLLADWFRQLWAESLGKRTDSVQGLDHVGFTPIKALGTTDQHSQVQLYRDGPNDKVFCLVEVEKFARDVPIPTGLGVEAIRYLEGSDLGTLLNKERRATEYALVESQRPNFTLTFPAVNERTVGQFMYLWEMVTAYAGRLLGIDAYDQPAVETGKQATFGLMGRAGYENWSARVERTLQKTQWTI